MFGVYLLGLGLTLTIAPNLLLAPFGFPPTSEVWVRVAGVLVLCISYYYVQSARRDLREFLRWTVHARVFVFLSFGLFSLLRLAEPALALFGMVDLACAVWTWLALRRSMAAQYTTHPSGG